MFLINRYIIVLLPYLASVESGQQVNDCISVQKRSCADSKGKGTLHRLKTLALLLLERSPVGAFNPCDAGIFPPTVHPSLAASTPLTLERRNRFGHDPNALTLTNEPSKANALAEKEEDQQQTREGRRGSRKTREDKQQTREDSRKLLVDLETHGKQTLEDASQGIPKVVLKNGKARLFRDGNPLVFSAAVGCVIGKQPKAGDAVLVADGARTPIGWGMFNPNSSYRVRILQNALDVTKHPNLVLNVKALVQQRMHEAANLRRGLGVMPASTTSNKAFRLINSESDGLSGIIVDVFAHAAVVQSSAAWAEKHRNMIQDALRDEVGFVKKVIWQRAEAMLRLEGINTSDDGGVVSDAMEEGTDDHAVEVEEHGLKYLVDVQHGQKTGFYCDQRDNRAWLGSLPLKGKHVLDLCSYTGGFALNAARGGAAKVIGVDSSQRAVETAQANAALNGFSNSTIEFRAADALAEAGRYAQAGELFDVVILDPPKLAPNAKAVSRAKRKYMQFQRAGMRALRPGGILITCSCSGAVAQSGLLRDLVEDVAVQEGRRATLLRRAGAAPDHVISSQYKESQYLDCLAYTIW